MFDSVYIIYSKIINYIISPQMALLIGEPFFKLIGLHKRETKFKLSDLKTILIVRLDEIGDIVMTTPFLRELRQNAKNAWITLIVKPKVFNLVELCPYVNEILTYERNPHGHYNRLIGHIRAIYLASKHLWHRRFHVSILPRWDWDYYNASFVCYFSGAVHRIAYSENINEDKKIYNKNYDLLFNHILNDSNPRHEVEYGLNIIRYLDGIIMDDHLEIWLSNKDEFYAKEILKRYKNSENQFLFIAIAPGARSHRRQWPTVNYIKIARWLIDSYNSVVLLFGGSDDEPIGKQFEDNIQEHLINLIGQTSLRETAAIMKECHLFIGNDSGPMHLAAAVGAVIIEITCHPKSGSPIHDNSPQRFGPWKAPSIILQPERAIEPCKNSCLSTEAHCIKSISTEQVIYAIQKQLSNQEYFADIHQHSNAK